jgi:predicted DCC family thiol-disulfide oxidoreductase YuxK
VCNFCNASVQWIIRRDREARFLFAPLQSELGKKAKEAVGDGLDSLILRYDGRYYTKSDAALRIASLLGRPWSFLSVLKIFPGSLRNAVYDLIARNRYRWFGRRDACMMPTPALRKRFLEDAPSGAVSIV